MTEQADFNVAAERIQQLAQQFKYMGLAAAALAQIGNLDSAAKERRGVLTELDEVIACKTLELTDMRARVACVHEEKARLLVEAHEEADSIIARAKAVAEAETLTIIARNEVLKAEADKSVEAKSKALDKKATAAKAEVEAAVARTEEANAELLTASKELRAIEAKLATAREAMAKLLGA